MHTIVKESCLGVFVRFRAPVQQTSFKESKANYDRNKTLFDKGIISKSDWDKAIAV
jgi:hypothetical protein